MDGGGLDAGLLQERGQLVAAVLGLGEHQRLRAAVLGDQVQQQFALARGVDRVHAVGDGLGHGVARGDHDFARMAHELHRQLLDRLGEGGREQQGLAVLARQLGQDALDRGQKAHVEHAVGLVEHQHLDAGQVDAAAFQVVDQAARAGDQQVHATAQGVELIAHAHATVDHGAGDALVLAVAAQAVMHLGGELTGRGEDQRARLARAVDRLRGGGQVLQHRQAERSGLAGTGLGAGQQVVAFEHQRDGFALDRGRGFVTLFGERAQQEGRKAQGFKRHGFSPEIPAHATSRPTKAGGRLGAFPCNRAARRGDDQAQVAHDRYARRTASDGAGGPGEPDDAGDP